ncbi:MAG: SusC/RagA family TonB-linked outer membrane protein [Bacteroidales bacterium]|nr:SusC/RagA family TonB-linked outer membrane protein [Bacteroidales bacterium]
MGKKTYTHWHKMLLAVLTAILLPVAAFAQPAQITGQVTDSSGEPLAGVTVIEKGTMNGVTTDADGRFSIRVGRADAVLTFTCLSFMTQEIPVKGRTQISVSLKDDALSLNESVVTGYGQVVSKDKLTAAVSKVGSEELSKGAHSNVIHALSGSVTGVRIATTTGQPGTSPDIVIRGGAALNGTGTPLYVVDGVQKPDMSDINANDIESIEILKDAAATALYGAKANAGVILVTTRQGHEGKSEIVFKSNTGISRLRNTNNFLEADDYLYYLRLAAYRSGNTAALSAAGPYGTGNLLEANGNESAEGVYSTMFLTDENAYLLDKGYKSMVDPITGKTIIYQEFKSSDVSVRDVAITQDYNISASGGNSKGKYYVGLGYYDEQGFPVISSYERLSLTTNASYKITPWLEAKSGVSFSRSNMNKVSDYISGGEKNFFGIMYSAPPTMRRYNPDGEEIICTTNWENGNWEAAQDFFYRRHTNYRLTVNSGLNFRVTKHLSAKVNAMWYLNMTESEKANKAYLSRPGIWNSDRGVTLSYARRLDQTYNAMFSYENSWNGHNLNVIGGYEYYDKFTYSFNAYGQGSDTDDFISLSYFDKTVQANISKINMGSSHVEERSMSFFGNAMYDYEGKYLFSFSARYDGYSKLVNNKWGFFPGVSAAWNIHKEDFMRQYDHWLTGLKLRVGYGQNGNVNILSGAYDLQGNYGKTGSYAGTYGILINKLSYPDLRWEKTTSTDIAVETALWNRVKASVGVYNKLTSDLLASVPFPSSSGVGSQYTNNGSVRNRGLELELSGTILKNKDWKVTAGVNATYMRSKIISLPENGNENNRQGGSQVYDPDTGELIWVGGYQEGQEYGVAYAWKMVDIVRGNEDLDKYAWYKDVIPAGGTIYGPAIWETLTAEEQAAGQLLQPGDAIFYDVNGDQVIDNYDKIKVGNTIPRWVGGFNFSSAWKGLSLYAKFDYAAGYVAPDSRRRWYMGLFQGTFNTIKESKDTWSEYRPDATYPILMYADSKYRANYRLSDIFYEDCSYICARDITLSYSLPKKVCEAVRLQNFILSVTGQNLFYITKSKIYSPEYGAEDEGGYGIPRTLLLGVKATF